MEFKLGNMSKAKEAFNEALRMNPEAYDAIIYLLEIELISGDPKVIERELDKIFKKDDSIEELYYAMTLVCLKTKDNDLAGVFSDLILDTYPEDTFALSVKKFLEL